jgi:hypothetical protein
MLVKSKLTQQDLDEVLRILKERDNSMNGFSQYDNTSSSSLSKKANLLPCQLQKENQIINDNGNGCVNETAVVDLDSTLVVADNSSNNLNTSA